VTPEDPNRDRAGARPPAFDAPFRAKLHELFVWRRDVRRFRTDPLPPGTLEQLIGEACLGPSVGFSQPWRFVIVEDAARRAEIVANFRQANADALLAYAGERQALYAQLKLAGLEEAPGHLAVFADEATEVGHALGRRTMPETVRYSAVAAVVQMSLAARAQGIGLGWISILDPAAAAATLEVPPHWALIGYFCLGYPQEVSAQPELEREGWERRLTFEDLVLRR
jgi:5,6-dimethylbenzimidazole synthase